MSYAQLFGKVFITWTKSLRLDDLTTICQIYLPRTFLWNDGEGPVIIKGRRRALSSLINFSQAAFALAELARFVDSFNRNTKGGKLNFFLCTSC